MLLRELGFPRGAQVSIGSKEEADWGRLPPRLHSRQSHFLSSVLHIVFHVTFFFLIKAFGCFFKKCFFLNLKSTQTLSYQMGKLRP